MVSLQLFLAAVAVLAAVASANPVSRVNETEVGTFKRSCRPNIVEEASLIRPLPGKTAEVALIVTCGECGNHSDCPDTDFFYWVDWGNIVSHKRTDVGHLLQLQVTHEYFFLGKRRITAHFCSKPGKHELAGCDSFSQVIRLEN